MVHRNSTWLLIGLLLCQTSLADSPDRQAARIPDKLVVLTFDDSAISHATIVAPLLKKHGFGATFFITKGFDFATNKKHYMTWKQIKALSLRESRRRSAV